MTTILTEVDAAAAALADALASARRAVVLTGAGISTESGIPDFRSPGGIWTRMKPILFETFLRSEAARLEDWRRRFEMARLFAGAEPNAAHRGVARLAREGGIALVVTQNIDGLHARAGTPPDRLVEIHGTAAHAACLDCGRRHELDWAQERIATTGAAPRCDCGGLVKAAVVSFGQPMPEPLVSRAVAAAASADLFVSLGTSLVVYPVAALPRIAWQAGARLVIASRDATELDADADLVIRTSLAATFATLEPQ
jgi:NAD-dependent deacetylase